ncbi:g6984 [Coccomyxa viridis]|uniref:G6984 protein n=1 Tax=Coccomyxa viridis TaxID=1274662 RepID=A0ABP1G1M2_9CHLO
MAMGKDPKFLCGVAVSVYQNSGDPNANWAYFQEQKAAHVNFNLRLSTGCMTDFHEPGTDTGSLIEAEFPKLGPSKIQKNARIGKASDFWNRYEQDIKLSADLGCNSFRLSIEWSRLFPQRGKLCQEAVNRYNEIFDCLEKHGMEPNITLIWFVQPQWFQKMGAFARRENIPVFVEWCETAFKLFGKRAKLWTTFNEPGVAAICGHIIGNHPPGKILHFREAAVYLRHELEAHALAYKAIKALPGGDKAEVGICHNVFWTEPAKGGPFYAHVRAAVKFGNRIWGNHTVMTYLKTGVFDYWVPVGRPVHWEDPNGKPGCDFMGVNHYARGVVGFALNPTSKGPKGIADMGYPVYPPSLYRAVSYVSTLGVPVYILENGMPAKEDDERRTEWIDGCMAEVEKLIDDGYDVRGYYYWTLLDNFEWNFAFELKFGLYEWVDNGKQERKLREGAKTIKTWYKYAPDILGKKLANRKKLGGVIPQEQREKNEKEDEEEYMRKEGFSEEKVDDLLNQDSDPIVTGVY